MRGPNGDALSMHAYNFRPVFIAEQPKRRLEICVFAVCTPDQADRLFPVERDRILYPPYWVDPAGESLL